MRTPIFVIPSISMKSCFISKLTADECCISLDVHLREVVHTWSATKGFIFSKAQVVIKGSLPPFILLFPNKPSKWFCDAYDYFSPRASFCLT